MTVMSGLGGVEMPSEATLVGVTMRFKNWSRIDLCPTLQSFSRAFKSAFGHSSGVTSKFIGQCRKNEVGIA